MTVDIASRFSDPDGDQLTFQVTSGDSGVVRVLISEGGLILAPLSAGTTTVTVTAMDPGGLSASQTFAVTVGTPNRPPAAVGAIPDQTLTVGGTAVTLQLLSRFSDPDGDPLAFLATPDSSGVVRVVVDGGDLILLPEAVGSTTVTVTATDPGGLSASQTFAVTVGTPNRPPAAVGTIPDQTLTVGGTAVTLELAPRFSDPDGDPLTFQATPDRAGVARAIVDGGDLILLPEAVGSTTVAVTATDPGGLSAGHTFAVTVAPGNRAPAAVGRIPDQTLTVGGSAVTMELASRFSDPDGDSLTFRAMVDNPGVVRVTIDEEELVVIPEGMGTATVTITAADPDGLTAVQRFRATVEEPARAPATPTGLRVAETGPDFIEWTWNTVPDATGYEVQFSEDHEFTSADPTHDVGAEHSYRESGLDFDTRAYLRVRAYVGSGADRRRSAWSGSATALTTPAPPPPASRDSERPSRFRHR